jgi:hypothetical protein
MVEHNVDDSWDDDDSMDDDPRFSPDPEVRKQLFLDIVQVEVNRFTPRTTAQLNRLKTATADAISSRREFVGGLALIQSLPEGDLRETAQTLDREIEDLRHELGFRNDTMTGQEHIDCGSSGFGKWNDVDPNVPIALLEGQLRARGEGISEDYPTQTIEESDHARRLKGRTRLDLETGHVTDEIDEVALANPYHFADAETKARIVLRMDEISEKMNAIVQQALDQMAERHTKLPALIEAYLAGWTSMRELIDMNQNCGWGADFSGMFADLRRITFELGTRDWMLTPQEILIRTGGTVDERYLAHPYRPLGIQDGHATREEVNLHRLDEAFMAVNNECLGHERPLGFIFEELDENGDTLQSPRLCNEHNPTFIHPEEWGVEVAMPMSRPGEWHYRV